MDFFGYQEAARRKTKWLVVFFAMAVVMIIASVYLAALPCYFYFNTSKLNSLLASSKTNPYWWWLPEVFFTTVFLTAIIVTCGCYFMMRQLRDGGSAVALMLGGTLIDPNTTNADERRLLNVVEEMSIASGVAVPEVYILEEEAGMNAFAAGYSLNDVAIGVTKGAVQKLSRDQLQGVIAHEFSHILHGDMRLNIRLISIIHGILGISTIGYWLLASMRNTSSRNRGALPIFMLGLVLIIIGSIGVFFSKLIKSAISRSREFLADAAAVQYTRNPLGLADALKTIAGYSTVASHHTETVSHMFFSRAQARSLFSFSWLSTHPPVEQRIARLDPSFHQAPQTSFISGLSESTNSDFGALSLLTQPVSHRIGKLNQQQVEKAKTWLQALPAELERDLRDRNGAKGIVYAMLLDDATTLRQLQLDRLKRSEDTLLMTKLANNHQLLHSYDVSQWLSLIDLAMPALRRLTLEAYHQFMDNIRYLIESDSKLRLFEFALVKILHRHLSPTFGKVDKDRVRYRHLHSVLTETILIFSALAHTGTHDHDQAAAAFDETIAKLCRQRYPMIDASEIRLTDIEKALSHLAKASPSLKRDLMEAAAMMAKRDHVLKSGELTLLRAFADAMGCPLPPMYLTN